MLSRELSHLFLPEGLFSDPRVSEKGLHILSEVIGFDEGICRRPRRDISDADKELVVEWSQIRELAKTNKM